MAVRRSGIAFALFVAVMLVLPLLLNSYIVSVLVVVLFAAYFGQAWNIVTGFAGQLSLGHALYVGLGAYASAALFLRYGVPPWLGMLVGAVIAALAGGLIAALSFRFRVGGVYFALLTIAFASSPGSCSIISAGSERPRGCSCRSPPAPGICCGCADRPSCSTTCSWR